MVTKKPTRRTTLKSKFAPARRQIRSMKSRGYRLELSAISEREAKQIKREFFVPVRIAKNPIGRGYNVWVKDGPQ